MAARAAFVAHRHLSRPSASLRRLPLAQTRTVSPALASLASQRRAYADAPHGLARDEVKHRILDILYTFDKADRTKVNENAHFVSDLGLDSLDVVEVVMAVEEEFAIEIPDEAADRIMSVPDAISYVTSQPEAI